MEELLREFVAIPSVSGQEEELAVFIARLCRGRGHETWTVNGNVAVLIRGLDRHRALIYNGHLDTVPGDWSPPRHMVVKEDRLEGVGVTDMKSGLAVMVMMAQIYEFSPPLCDIWLFFSREEETTAQGSVDLAMWWSRKFGGSYGKKAVLILEPTGGAYVAFSHKGGGIVKATINGYEACHASANLVNEVTVADVFCQFGLALKRRQAEWLNRYPDIGYGVATINLTRFASQGTVSNIVPAAVEVWIDVRTNGSLDRAALGREFGNFRRRFGVELSLEHPEYADVVQCDNPQPLVDAFAVGWSQLPQGVFPAATDMSAFRWVGLPVAIVGPGNESLHQVGEHVERGSMERCLAGLLAVTQSFALL